jgi:hypothetical protein
MTEPKSKPDIDLALIMGGPKGKAPKGEPMADEEDESDGDELPAGFEEAFAEAFPEAAGDTERMQAVKRLIHLCTDSY